MPSTSMYLPLLTPLILVLVVLFIIVGLKLLLINAKYKVSGYRDACGNSFFQTVFSKGNYGEFLLFRVLEKLSGENKLLANVYLPEADRTTTEVDLLLINQTGIYVFESKNYSGWIFGDEKNKMWTQTLKNGKKSKFFNPIWQNKGHMSALEKVLPVDSNLLHSYIVFSERCKLKNVKFNSVNVHVIKRDRLRTVLEAAIKDNAELLSELQINEIYDKLRSMSCVSEEIKKQHIENISRKRV